MTRAGFGSTFDCFSTVTREIARGMTDVGVGSGALLAERRRGPQLKMTCVPTPRIDLGLRIFVHPAGCESETACDTEAAKLRVLASNPLSSRASNRNLSTTSRIHLAASELSVSPCMLRIATFLPANVKDEPRRDLARGVPFLTRPFRKPFLHDS
jgi:hypothetical protein